MKKRFTLAGLSLGLLIAIAGCGSGSSSGNGNTPVPPAGTSGTKSYTYAGTQSVDGFNDFPYGQTFRYGGAWVLTLDDTNNYFSYQNVGHDANNNALGVPGLPLPVPVTGGTAGSGFFSLTPNVAGSPDGSGGYVVEIPGEGALVRPNTQTVIASGSVQVPSTPMVAPTVFAASASCPVLSGNETFQFIALGSQLQNDIYEHVVYGSVQVSGTGTAYTFSNLNMYGFAGDSLSPDALPVGNCGTTQEGYAISMVAPEQYTYYLNGNAVSKVTDNFTLTTAISPSGLFIMDQGQGDPYIDSSSFGAGIGVSGATDLQELVGVVQPASPLSASSLVGAKYLGFEYDALDVSLNRAASNPVMFGQTAGSGTVMTGGGYANDDVTQTPVSNITIDLGQQDSANNGLYKNVIVTVPDTYDGCNNVPFGGTDANGNPTCTFPGVAVAGTVAGKFVIFVSVNDLSQSIAHYSPYATLQFFLYQQ